MTEIRNVAVFGAGVMGASIAAHVANAGIKVRLLDIAKTDGPSRSTIAIAAVDRLLKMQPAPLMHRRNAELITPGNIDDDIAGIADCDWIIEAIVERVDLKRTLYEKIERARRPGSVVSSNTSTIPLATLVETMPDSFAADFLITHFFNPPRYLRLLEVTAGARTRKDAVETISRFADLRLGKTVVRCKDTPGFIGNRIGIYWLQCSVLHAMEAGLTVEEADAVLGRPMGVPKTGVFGLLDMVGLDLMPHVLGSMAASLPKEDPFHAVFREPALIKKMIAEGYTGRKGKGGFYRLKPDDPGKAREAIDLTSGAYRATRKAALASVAQARKRGLRRPVRADRPARHRLVRGSPPRRRPAGARSSAERERAKILSDRVRAAPALHRRRRLSRRRPAGRRPAARRHQAPQAARGPQPLGEPVGHRRRRPVPRISQQDELTQSAIPADGR